MTCQSTNNYVTASIMVAFHAPFPVLTLILRPFRRPINNLIEFMIDILLLGCAIWLLVMNDFTWYTEDLSIAGHYIVLGWIMIIFLVFLIDIFGTCFYRIVCCKKIS